MDQCSGHDIPPAIGPLADREGHDQAVEFKALPSNKCSPSGG
jgi:hypothetical protein